MDTSFSALSLSAYQYPFACLLLSGSLPCSLHRLPFASFVPGDFADRIYTHFFSLLRPKAVAGEAPVLVSFNRRARGFLGRMLQLDEHWQPTRREFDLARARNAQPCASILAAAIRLPSAAVPAFPPNLGLSPENTSLAIRCALPLKPEPQLCEGSRGLPSRNGRRREYAMGVRGYKWKAGKVDRESSGMIVSRTTRVAPIGSTCRRLAHPSIGHGDSSEIRASTWPPTSIIDSRAAPSFLTSESSQLLRHVSCQFSSLYSRPALPPSPPTRKLSPTSAPPYDTLFLRRSPATPRLRAHAVFSVPSPSLHSAPSPSPRLSSHHRSPASSLLISFLAIFRLGWIKSGEEYASNWAPER
ncbi:hypothetical protein C8R45DRAFT_1208993 [Mycena sanguinolenta]|nr:hypothetical protein C8R45DRAFT_1208993 [Mycena sanguinolenta]